MELADNPLHILSFRVGHTKSLHLVCILVPEAQREQTVIEL